MTDFLTQAFLAPLAAVILSALSVWINEGRQRRSREHQRRKRLADARDDVAFLDAWLRAHQQAAPQPDHDEARAWAIRDLERVYSAFTDSSTLMLREDERATFGQVLRSLFLIGKPKRSAAKVARALYYATLAWLVFLAAGLAEGTAEEASSGWDWLWAVLGFLVLGIVPAWIIRTWAISVDRPGEIAVSLQPPPSRGSQARDGSPYLEPRHSPPPAAAGSASGST